MPADIKAPEAFQQILSFLVFFHLLALEMRGSSLDMQKARDK